MSRLIELMRTSIAKLRVLDTNTWRPMMRPHPESRPISTTCSIIVIAGLAMASVASVSLPGPGESEKRYSMPNWSQSAPVTRSIAHTRRISLPGEARFANPMASLDGRPQRGHHQGDAALQALHRLETSRLTIDADDADLAEAYFSPADHMHHRFDDLELASALAPLARSGGSSSGLMPARSSSQGGQVSSIGRAAGGGGGGGAASFSLPRFSLGGSGSGSGGGGGGSVGGGAMAGGGGGAPDANAMLADTSEPNAETASLIQDSTIAELVDAAPADGAESPSNGASAPFGPKRAAEPVDAPEPNDAIRVSLSSDIFASSEGDQARVSMGASFGAMSAEKDFVKDPDQPPGLLKMNEDGTIVGDPNEPDDPAEDAPTLIPGNGWAGPTPQPPPVGDPSDPGYDAKAIARWDVVPYQTFDGIFEIGVVAFHMNEILKVDFSVEGGPWTSVYEMSENPRTGVWEYWVNLDASLFADDGPISVRAIAWPTVGEPRVLDDVMVLNANDGGSLPELVRWVDDDGDDDTGDGSAGAPYATIFKALQSVRAEQGDVDGAIIYLNPGEYSWGPYSSPTVSNSLQWATIMPSPGTTREEAIIAEAVPGGLRTNLIRAHNVTFAPGVLLLPGSIHDMRLWIDQCVAVGEGPTSDSSLFRGQSWTDAYVTSSSLSEYTNGTLYSSIVRNTSLEDLGSDAFSMSRLVVNSSVDGIDPGNTPYHPDIFQLLPGNGENTDLDNYIVYNVRATGVKGQGLFARGDSYWVDNVAFVNVLAERPDVNAGGQACQWMVRSNHLLLHHVTLANYAWAWRSPELYNVDIKGTMFHHMSVGNTDSGDPAVFDESWFSHNHFVDTTTYGWLVAGDDATIGDAGFVGNDYVPAGNSPLVGRVMDALSPIDADGDSRPSPAAIGAQEPVFGP